MTKLEFVEFYTKTTGKFAVYVNYNDFEEVDNSTCSWNLFVRLLSRTFGFIDGCHYADLILCDEVIIFDNKEQAEELYAVLNEKPYYGEVYAYLCGPNGMIDDNT